MKRLAWMIVAACSLLYTPTFGQPRLSPPWTYQSNEGDYVLSLPTGWRQVTKVEFEAQAKLFKERTGNIAPNYDSGFQLADREPFEYPYPYIFVQRAIPRPMSYDQLKVQVDSQMLSRAAKEASGKLAAVLAPIRFTAIHLFEEKKVIVMDFDSNADDRPAMKGMTAWYLGRQGVLSINFYAYNDNYGEYAATFQQILDSFKYLPGYEYQGPPPFYATWDISRIVSAAIIAAMLSLFGFRRRKKTAS
jgi:hypothetical protein